MAMYDSVAPTRYPNGSCALLENGRIQADGTVRRRYGSVRSSVTAITTEAVGYGGTMFQPVGKEAQICVWYGSEFYVSEDWGFSWSLIASNQREQYWSLASMRIGASSYLLAANGGDTIKRWDGTTYDDVPNAPSGVTSIATFNGRLYATGHSGVFVAASEIANIEVWAAPNGILLQVGTHDYEENTAMHQIGDHLLVFKRNSTSHIDGYGEQTLIVAQDEQGFSRSVGCIAPRSIATIGDVGLAWLSLRGVEYYTPQTGINMVTRSVDEFMSQIDWESAYNYPEQMVATYDSKEQNYILAMSTNGIQNNRLLVLNIRENVLDQRRGKIVAAGYDKLLSAAVNEYTFGALDSYLKDDVAGEELLPDVDGYITLAGTGVAGWPVEDFDGYLVSALTNYMPTALFTAPAAGNPTAMWSLAHDGYCRIHWGVDKDDTRYTMTGGVEVYMTVISKPKLMGKPRHRKKGRVIHVATLQESSAAVQVRLRGRGTTTAFKTLTMDALGLDHASRKRAGVSLVADAPQVEIKTKDDVRLSLLGLSAEVLKEQVG